MLLQSFSHKENTKKKGQTSRNVARYAYEQGYSRPWGKKYQVQVPPTCTCLPIFSNFAYRIQVTSCEALSSTDLPTGKVGTKSKCP